MEKSIKLVRAEDIIRVTYAPRTRYELTKTVMTSTFPLDEGGRRLNHHTVELEVIECEGLDLAFYPLTSEYDPDYKIKRVDKNVKLFYLKKTAKDRLNEFLSRHSGYKLESKSTNKQYLCQKPRLIIELKDMTVIDTYHNNCLAKARLAELQKELESGKQFIQLTF
jgi:hypothetical protein